MPRYGLPGQQISYDYFPNKRADAPVLVLQHGFTASSVTWNANITNLRKHYSVLLPDLLGHGGSDAPPDPAAYRPERAVERLVGLFDQLAIERAVFCGHSLGGALGLRFALDHPERLHGLVIINSNSAAGTAQWRNEVRPGMINLAERVNSEGTGFLKKTRLYPGQGKRLDRKSRAALMKAFDSLKPAGLANTARSLVVDVNCAERLGELRVPLLVVIGTRDAEFAANAPAFIAKFPSQLVQVVTLDDAGHAANIEKPKEFEAALLAFTDGLGPIPPRPEPGTTWAAPAALGTAMPVAPAAAAAATVGAIAATAPEPSPEPVASPPTPQDSPALTETPPVVAETPAAVVPQASELEKQGSLPEPAVALAGAVVESEALSAVSAGPDAGSVSASEGEQAEVQPAGPPVSIDTVAAAASGEMDGRVATEPAPDAAPGPGEGLTDADGVGTAAVLASASALAAETAPVEAVTPDLEPPAAADATGGAAVREPDEPPADSPDGAALEPVLATVAGAGAGAATLAAPPVIAPPAAPPADLAPQGGGGPPPGEPPVAAGGGGEGERRKRPKGLLIVMGATLVAAGVGMFVAGALLLDRGGGSNTPVDAVATTPASTATPTHTPTHTVSPTKTGTPSVTATGSPTATPSASATQTGTATHTPTPRPTATPTGTQTPAPSSTPTTVPTSTPTPSPTNTVAPTATPTATPPGPRVSIAGPSNVAAGGSGTFVGSASPAPITYRWFLNGSALSNGPSTTTISFPAAGCYTVQMVAIYDSGNETASQAVAVGGASC